MLFTLPPAPSGTPLYDQITRMLKHEIRTGALAAGTKLPSKRKLADQLSVSVTTVDTAYGQLVSEGFLDAQPKRGFFVCPLDTLLPASVVLSAPPADVEAPAPIEVDFLPAASMRGFSLMPFGVSCCAIVLMKTTKLYCKMRLRRVLSPCGKASRNIFIRRAACAVRRIPSSSAPAPSIFYKF